MILRIVKMEFKEAEVTTFLNTFKKYEESIRNQAGCSSLVLLRDEQQNNVFFTHSYWESLDDLENYRHSATFKEVWPLTKIHFSAKPEAWSLVIERGALPRSQK